jgi:hypothetical protein
MRAFGLSRRHIRGLDHLGGLEARPLGHRRVDETGADRDRAHPVRVELGIHRPGQRDHRGLRRAVNREGRRRQGAGDRGQVHDPATRLFEQRNRLARDQQEATQVDPQLQVDVLGLKALGGARDADAGGVHEHVQPAEALAVLADDANRVSLVTDVRRHRVRAELGRGGLDLRLRSRGERQLEALVAEHPCDGEADSRRAACYECARHAANLVDRRPKSLQ